MKLSLITSALWYKKANVAHLFVHLLTKVAHEPTTINGVAVNKGQVLTSRKQLCFETGMSEQTIRTCLKTLVLTNELTNESTNQFTILTICGYDSYFDEKKKANQRTNQRTNQRKTNEKPEVNPDLHPLGKLIQENYPRVSKLDKQLTNDNCEELLTMYSQDLIIGVIENMENSALLSKYKSVFLTLKNWAKKVKSQPPPATTFQQSPLFNPNTFASTFINWSKEKLRKYYDKSVFLSGEGKRYVNWELAINSWEATDEQLFKDKTKTPQESRIDKIKNYGSRETTTIKSIGDTTPNGRILPDSNS